MYFWQTKYLNTAALANKGHICLGVIHPLSSSLLIILFDLFLIVVVEFPSLMRAIGDDHLYSVPQ